MSPELSFVTRNGFRVSTSYEPHLGVKVLCELSVRRIKPKGLPTCAFLKWVLCGLQLKTYDLRLFREDDGGAASQAQRPRGVAFVHANFHEPARA